MCDKELARCEVGQKAVDIGVVSLGYIELAGRNVDPRKPQLVALEVEGCEVVVLCVREHALVSDHAWGDDLDDATFDELFGELGVFELFADGDALSGANEFGEVDVESVVGEAREIHFRGRSVRAFGESNAEDAGDLDGVFVKRFVEVAHAEEK